MIVQKAFRQENLNELKSLVSSVNYQKVFLVRGNNSYFNSGSKHFIDELLDGNHVVSFSEFNTNPQLSDLIKGINLFCQEDFDIIIAIGGGSVIDMAKLISVFAHQNSNDIEAVVTGKKELFAKNTPVLGIPTTAGSGAEATEFSVLYIDKTKYSVAHRLMRPQFVYLSYEFSMSASKYLAACTGLDAFCQAVESIWNINASEESMKYALEAIDLVWNNLSDSVNKNDALAKSKMQEASFLAGKAINITKTTAPHALSYAFTSYYGISHGHAVSLSLPFFFEFNYHVSGEDCLDSRGINSVKERIEKTMNLLNLNINNVRNGLTQFFNSVGINIDIHKLIPNFEQATIIDHVNIERLNNNPRKVNKKDIEEFLMQ